MMQNIDQRLKSTKKTHISLPQATYVECLLLGGDRVITRHNGTALWVYFF